MSRLTLLVAVCSLLACDEPRSVQVRQDIATCRGICGDRPIDDFTSGEGFRNMSCRCGKLDPPPPCDAGSPKAVIQPW